MEIALRALERHRPIECWIALAVALKENPKTKVKELRLRTDLASRGTAFKSAHFPHLVEGASGRFYL